MGLVAEMQLFGLIGTSWSRSRPAESSLPRSRSSYRLWPPRRDISQGQIPAPFLRISTDTVDSLVEKLGQVDGDIPGVLLALFGPDDETIHALYLFGFTFFSTNLLFTVSKYMLTFRRRVWSKVAVPLSRGTQAVYAD